MLDEVGDLFGDLEGHQLEAPRLALVPVWHGGCHRGHVFRALLPVLCASEKGLGLHVQTVLGPSNHMDVRSVDRIVHLLALLLEQIPPREGRRVVVDGPQDTDVESVFHGHERLRLFLRTDEPLLGVLRVHKGDPHMSSRLAPPLLKRHQQITGGRALDLRMCVVLGLPGSHCGVDVREDTVDGITPVDSQTCAKEGMSGVIVAPLAEVHTSDKAHHSAALIGGAHHRALLRMQGGGVSLPLCSSGRHVGGSNGSSCCCLEGCVRLSLLRNGSPGVPILSPCPPSTLSVLLQVPLVGA
mmetsp:Transcript_55407/g.108465  ORF Transcript_55407/g.108465 Transcript_55407/m.108465 type:complete len:298 (-) Transcript_55407:483-1376(-)